MAFFAKQFSLLLLLLLLLLLAFSSPRADASRFFFSKMTRSDDTKEMTTPAVVENNMPEKLPPQTKSGYGLYGHGHEQFSPTTATELSNENYYNDKKYNSDNTDPSFDKGRYETKETYDGKPWPSYEETRKQYGMSDTRFMENGRYYYDANGERYGGNGYGSYNRGRGGYGNGNEYKNEMEYQNNRENPESEEEYVP